MFNLTERGKFYMKNNWKRVKDEPSHPVERECVSVCVCVCGGLCE